MTQPVEGGDRLFEWNLSVCGCTFSVHCRDEELAALIRPVLSSLMVPPATPRDPIKHYGIERVARNAFRVVDGASVVMLASVDDLLFHLDKDITLTLQYARPDWLFLHAAAVAWEGRVAVLAAESGTGKSTLTAAALASGLEYLSDELAPIDLGHLTVQPFPHALCLKSPPPPPHALPAGTLLHGGRYYWPVAPPSVTHRDPLPLAALIFLERAQTPEQGLRRTSAGTAVARLMAQSLNALAHPGYGLDAAVALSRAVPCFQLDVTDLDRAVASVTSVLSVETRQPRATPSTLAGAA